MCCLAHHKLHAAVVGARVAAQLIGAVGGVTNLSRTPSCNVTVIGKTEVNAHRVGTGLSDAGIIAHVGFVGECDLVQSAPSDLRRRASKKVAAKVVLCARLDAASPGSSAELGQKFLFVACINLVN